MKTLLKVFAFSLTFGLISQGLLLTSCKNNVDSFVSATPKEQPLSIKLDSNQLVNFQYIQEVQQGVTDTSHTSLQASINTAFDVANKLDEVAYKASISAVRLNADAKELDNLHLQYQKDIEKYKKLSHSVKTLIQQKEYQLAKLKEKNESTRYFANLE